LDCFSYRQIGGQLGIDHVTVSACIGEKSDESGNSPPAASRQHFDMWSFPDGPILAFSVA
jgi:hypothetical protein